MPKGKKQTAGEQPLPQQRDERGGLAQSSVERLGDTGADPHGEPKLPHERDQTTGEESTASATGEGNRKLMRQAAKDIESGKLDTDRGPVTDATYHELRKNAGKKK
jgi:hypothetical protein